MNQIILIYSVCAFAFGMATITATLMCTNYSHNLALKKFSFFFIVFSVQVFISLLSGYIYDGGSGKGTFLMPFVFLTSFSAYILLLWAIAVLPLAIFREKRSVVWSILFFALYAAYFFLVLSGVDWRNTSAKYTVAPYLGPLNIFVLFGTNALCLLYSLFKYKKADNETRELLRFILPLLILFLPAWLADLFLPYSLTIVFSLTLYILFGILLLRFSLKIFRLAVSVNYSPTLAAGLFENILSKREKEILFLILQGEENFGIGKKLFISVNTVKTHIKNILRKTGTTDRFSLLLKISRLKSQESSTQEKDHPQG